MSNITGFENNAAVFQVLGSPVRRDMVWFLAWGWLSVNELTELCGAGRMNTSRHLGKLRDAGLVEVREDGRYRYSRLKPGALKSVIRWLDMVEVMRETGEFPPPFDDGILQ